MKKATLLFLLLVATCGWAQSVDRLDRVSGLEADKSGIALKDWRAKETLVRLGPDTYLPIQAYKGQVVDAKAHGFGRLDFGGPTLPPADPGAVVFTVTSDSYGAGFIYTGQFDHGRPKGQGTLYDKQSLTSLSGDFSDFFAVNGPATISILGRPSIFATMSGGSMAAGPLKLFLYPPNSDTPSRVFLGTFDGKSQQGAWTALPWKQAIPLGQIWGYRNITNFVMDDGERIVCAGTEVMDTGAGELAKLSGNLSDATWNIDPVTIPKVAACEQKTADGWTYSYRVVRAPFTIDPSGCKDPQGHAGSLAITADKSLQCSVTYTTRKRSNNLFAKVWREIERTPGNVKHAITHTGDELGQEFEKFICSLAGRKPGENCNVNVAVGVTMPLPGGSGATDGSAADPSRLKAAQESQLKISRVIADGNADLAWARGVADLYSICVEKCDALYSAYSLQRLQQLDFTLSAGAGGEQAGRQIASLRADITDIGQRVSQYIPGASYVYTFLRANRQLDRLSLAGQLVSSLPPVDFSGAQNRERIKVLTQLSAIGYRDVLAGELAPTALDYWSASYTSLFPDLPAMSTVSQVKFLHDLGVDIKDFAAANQHLDDTDKFIDAAIKAKLAPLGIQWPPTSSTAP